MHLLLYYHAIRFVELSFGDMVAYSVCCVCVCVWVYNFTVLLCMKVARDSAANAASVMSQTSQIWKMFGFSLHVFIFGSHTAHMSAQKWLK